LASKPSGLRSIRSSAGGAQLLLVRVRLADAQIFADRAVEQQRVLKHDADIVP